MQKLLLLFLTFSLSLGLAAQDAPLYFDNFDDGNVSVDGGDNFTLTEEDGFLNVTGTGNGGQFAGIYFDLGGTIDVTDLEQVYIRANANDFGTELRVDLVDVNNRFSNAEPITVTLTSDLETYTFDFSTVNTSTNGGEALDLTQIQALFIYFAPTVSGFTGTVSLDFISIGAEIAGPIMSDIYQDDMDSDSSLASFVFAADGLSFERDVDENGDSTVVSLVGDGTGTSTFAIMIYQLRPAPEFIPTSVDISENTTVYVRARASRPGVILRQDVRDIDEVFSNGTAIGRELADTFQVFEFDYAGARGFPVEGTACTEDNLPCIVDLENINQLAFYIDPGTAGFDGRVDIDWISFGVNLEGEGPEAPLTYAEDFSNNRIDFVGPVAGYTVREEGSSLFITGDGTGAPFSTVSYNFHTPADTDDTLVMQTTIDLLPAQERIFIRARTNGPDVLVRADVVDTTGALTDFSSARQTFTDEWNVYTFDYNGRYDFADYGEGRDDCSPEARCTVDATAIESILFFFDETTGGFEGEIEIDYISVGQPLSEVMETEPGVVNFSDDLEGYDGGLTGIYNGVVVSFIEDGGIIDITSTAPDMLDDFHQVRIPLREKVDVINSDNRMFISARVLNTPADTALIRIDLRDEAGFETSNAGVVQTITGEEFMTYEFNYAGRFDAIDGGYGGTSCTADTQPCDVDGERVVQLVLYPEPGGAADLDGTIQIDWIAFGEPLSINVDNFAELDLLRAFPNPAADQLNVEFELAGASDVTISVFDGFGRRQVVQNLGQRPAGRSLEFVDLSRLATGTYHVQVMVDGKPARAITVLKR